MDIRLASTQARIGFVFGQLDIVSEAAPSFFLPRIVGIQNALELVYAADILQAERAHEVGLVRSVHEPDDLLPEAHRLALTFVHGRSSAALAMARRLLYAGVGSSHPLEAHRRDSLAMWHATVGAGKEGVAGFLEKRDPVSTGTVRDVPELG